MQLNLIDRLGKKSKIYYRNNRLENEQGYLAIDFTSHPMFGNFDSIEDIFINGALVTDTDRIDELTKNPNNLFVIHAGPCQKNDYLSSFENILLWQYAMEKLGKKLNFFCLLGNENTDILSIEEWFQEKLPGLKVRYGINTLPALLPDKKAQEKIHQDLAISLIQKLEPLGSKDQLQQVMRAMVNSQYTSMKNVIDFAIFDAAIFFLTGKFIEGLTNES